jgi:hypothetical protein
MEQVLKKAVGLAPPTCLWIGHFHFKYGGHLLFLFGRSLTTRFFLFLSLFKTANNAALVFLLFCLFCVCGTGWGVNKKKFIFNFRRARKWRKKGFGVQGGDEVVLRADLKENTLAHSFRTISPTLFFPPCATIFFI